VATASHGFGNGVAAPSRVVAFRHKWELVTIEPAYAFVSSLSRATRSCSKTDVSDEGPQNGAPALVGAGMMGDRADVIFASPDEISGFVSHRC
jgi:hypothetical protein